MTIPFGENLDKSLAYANGALPTFGGWFILILLSALITGGAIVMLIAMLAILMAGFAILDPSMFAGVSQTELDMIIALFTGGGLIFLILGIIVMLLTEFFLYGFTMRVYRGDELNFKNLGQMFVQGIGYCIIMFLYMLPAVIISELVLLGPVMNMAYLIIVCTIIPIILSIISALLSINAIIRYAKEGRFGAAFQIGKICSIIGNIGWLRYVGHVLLLSIIILVIEMLLLMIPIAGWVLLIVATPFILIAQAKFLANLYESGEALEEYEEIADAMEA